MKVKATILMLLLLFVSNSLYSQIQIEWKAEPFVPVVQKLTAEDAWKAKTDPDLVYLHSQLNRMNKGAAELIRSEDSPLIFNTRGDKVSVLLKLDSINPQNIPGFTLQALSPDGTIAVGWLRADQIADVGQLKSIRKLEASNRSKIMNKSARAAIRADVVHEGGNGLSQGYTGKDVIVGIIDTGIDFSSPDFSNENGTRIVYLKELTEEGDDPAWYKEDIDADPSAVTQRDGFGGGGHGTHVAGSAVGNGSMNSDYMGMAPEAEIVFIKGVREADSDGGFGDNDILEGVQSIFDFAEEQGKPAVVNLSLGGNSGPLDGSSLYEQFLTDLQGEGKIIVAAAGNEGHDYLHTGADMTADEHYFTVDVTYEEAGYSKEIWYDKGAISGYKIFALEKENHTVVGETDWLTVGSSGNISVTDSRTSEAASYIYHTSTNAEDEQNGDGQIMIYIEDGQFTDESPLAKVDEYYWGVMYQASSTGGRFDAINSNGNSLTDTFSVEDANYIAGDRAHSVGSPASAKGVVSVGAFISANTWTTDDDLSYTLNYPQNPDWSETFVPEVGEIAYFSSRGPTRDGRIVPTITAPGDKIFSVRSTHIEDDHFDSIMLRDNGQYLGMQGTSMASPIAAGVIALMLEANPSLSYEDIVTIFSNTAVKDDQTGSEQNTTWGHGKIDAFSAVSEATTTTSIEDSQIPDQTVLHQNYPNPFNPSTVLSFTLANASDVSIVVYNVLGQVVRELKPGRLSAGLHSFTLQTSDLAGGVYLYQMRAGDLQITRKMTLIK